MGTRYLIRTSEQRVFSSQAIGYTDYRVDNIFECMKLLMAKKGKVLFVTRWYY